MNGLSRGRNKLNIKTLSDREKLLIAPSPSTAIMTRRPPLHPYPPLASRSRTPRRKRSPYTSKLLLMLNLLAKTSSGASANGSATPQTLGEAQRATTTATTAEIAKRHIADTASHPSSSTSSSSSPAFSHQTSVINSSASNNHNNNNNNNSSDDIYYNIVPTESDDFSSPAESNYIDDEFFNPSLYPTTSQDQVYDRIVKDSGGLGLQSQQSHTAPQQQPMRRDFVMREILNTEENFVAGLNTLMQDFLIPLSRVLKEPDRKCICINLDRLIELHTRLRNALAQACKGGHGRTQRICLVFESFKVCLISFFIILIHPIS